MDKKDREAKIRCNAIVSLASTLGILVVDVMITRKINILCLQKTRSTGAKFKREAII